MTSGQQAGAFPADVVERVRKHMNRDHGMDMTTMARGLGEQPNATDARMVTMDRLGLDLEVLVADAWVPARVPWSRELGEDGSEVRAEVTQRFHDALDELGEVDTVERPDHDDH